MARWIAFDQETMTALRHQLPQQHIFEHGAPNAVEYAVSGPEILVALIPVHSTGDAGVAIFRRRARAQQPVQPAKQETPEKLVLPQTTSPVIRAGGFLGLRDEAIFEEDQKAGEKKNWWLRFWDEDQ
ncbi:MAG: hypothetical protein ACRD4F_03005 [Candidatus Angelobacter sp.]